MRQYGIAVPVSPAQLSAKRITEATAGFAAEFPVDSGPGEQSSPDAEETLPTRSLLRARDPEGMPLLVSAFEAANTRACY
jgi:hypothetical protein